MLSFKLYIKSGNEAMQLRADVIRALLQVAGRLDNGFNEGYIIDDNGNRCGEWSYE